MFLHQNVRSRDQSLLVASPMPGYQRRSKSSYWINNWDPYNLNLKKTVHVTTPITSTYMYIIMQTHRYKVGSTRAPMRGYKQLRVVMVTYLKPPSESVAKPRSDFYPAVVSMACGRDWRDAHQSCFLHVGTEEVSISQPLLQLGWSRWLGLGQWHVGRSDVPTSRPSHWMSGAILLEFSFCSKEGTGRF